MRVLWLFLLQLVYTQAGFGRSYMRNSRLCHPWNCINEKLGLTNVLPPRDQYAAVLKSLLPEGPWQDVVHTALEVCYEDRPRRYTNTCPGQALLHCAVDNLINNCPEGNWRKDDACTPVSSIAGIKYMFSQSKYENLERNLPSETRPGWFLKNYFSTKCCDLPQLFNSTMLNECGFNTIIHYYNNKPRPNTSTSIRPIYMETSTESMNSENSLKIQHVGVEEHIVPKDPLDCCDMSEFIQPLWRSECGFQLTWEGQNRLSIKPDPVTIAPPTTTTARPAVSNDVKIVPQSCEKETCVFSKLNIITESGQVDTDAFSRLLDNLTSVHIDWRKAKARVVTKCLTKPIRDYEADCDINKVLACTFDVLSENCPYAKKRDPCKHTNVLKNDILCQISSSKLRPKNRRQYCGLPSIVNHEVLAECGVSSVSDLEYVPEPPATSRPGQSGWPSKYMCKLSTGSTNCVMNKMGVLNKYGFMDYFKMKDRIRSFTSQSEWAPLTDVYISAYSGLPMYRNHCSSPKRLLNVIDAMLMTCPITKRKNDVQCKKIFDEMVTTRPMHENGNITKELIARALGHFHHVFSPDQNFVNFENHSKNQSATAPRRDRVVKQPTFSFGLLGSANAPKVRIINIKPRVVPRRPLILLPVYHQFTNNLNGRLNLYLQPNDRIMRNAPLQTKSRLTFPYSTEPTSSTTPGCTTSNPIHMLP